MTRKNVFSKPIYFKSILLIFLIIISNACEKAVVNTEPTQVKQAEQLPKDIKLRISYNEKTFTTSTQWPESIIGGLNKTNTDEELLVDFQNVKTIIELDTLGYFSKKLNLLRVMPILICPWSYTHPLKAK